MPVKLKNSSEALLNKELPAKNGGYDSFEVDSLLDNIIKDYEVVESGVLLSKKEYEDLQNELASLKKQVIDLKVEADLEKAKWKDLRHNPSEVHLDNLELLKRIGKLEKIIEEKMHLNPDEI